MTELMEFFREMGKKGRRQRWQGSGQEHDQSRAHGARQEGGRGVCQGAIEESESEAGGEGGVMERTRLPFAVVDGYCVVRQVVFGFRKRQVAWEAITDPERKLEAYFNSPSELKTRGPYGESSTTRRTGSCRHSQAQTRAVGFPSESPSLG